MECSPFCGVAQMRRALLPVHQREKSVGTTNTFRILALDGGGTRGIYTAQLLAKIEEAFGTRIKTYFRPHRRNKHRRDYRRCCCIRHPDDGYRRTL